MKNEEQQTKPATTDVKSIYRAILEKAIVEPNYFNEYKPLNCTKFNPRDRKGLGLQLRMSV